jgi:hypothetical protein
MKFDKLVSRVLKEDNGAAGFYSYYEDWIDVVSDLIRNSKSKWGPFGRKAGQTDTFGIIQALEKHEGKSLSDNEIKNFMNQWERLDSNLMKMWDRDGAVNWWKFKRDKGRY